MGLFDVFRAKNSTQDWQPDPRLQLTFNFDNYTLCGVGLREPVSRLCGLGPAEDRHDARSGIYRYYSKGLSITTDDNRIHAFVLVWQDPDRPEYRPYAGICTMYDMPLPLSADVSALQFVQLFGEPDDRSPDTLVYRKGEVLLDADFGDDDRLDYLIIGLKDGCKQI